MHWPNNQPDRENEREFRIGNDIRNDVSRFHSPGARSIANSSSGNGLEAMLVKLVKTTFRDWNGLEEAESRIVVFLLLSPQCIEPLHEEQFAIGCVPKPVNRESSFLRNGLQDICERADLSAGAIMCH